MDLTRLKYFVVLAEAGHLRKASERLRISPAALSKAIKILGDELDEELVVPNGRGLRITESGFKLAARVRPLLREFETLKGDLSRRKQSCQALHLGVGSDLPSLLLTEIHGLFFLGEKLRARVLDPDRFTEELAADRMDAVISFHAPVNPRLESLTVAEVEMRVFGRVQQFRGMDFNDLPFAVPSAGDGWPAEWGERKTQFELPTLDAALEFCRQGLAVTCLPEFVARIFNLQHVPKHQLETLPLPSGRGPARRRLFIHKAPGESRLVIKKLLRGCKLIVQSGHSSFQP
jgi:DNA-binding transcriptional LysR family regulator